MIVSSFVFIAIMAQYLLAGTEDTGSHMLVITHRITYFYRNKSVNKVFFLSHLVRNRENSSVHKPPSAIVLYVHCNVTPF